MKLNLSPEEVYGKCTPFTSGTFYGDIPPVGLDDMFNNGKAQPRAP